MCKNFEDIDLDDVESTFKSNIIQAFAITKYAIPHMQRGDSYVTSLVFLPQEKCILTCFPWIG